MKPLKCRPRNSGIKSLRILRLLIPLSFLLFTPSQPLTITYMTESVKKNVEESSKLSLGKELAGEVLKNKYLSLDSERIGPLPTAVMNFTMRDKTPSLRGTYKAVANGNRMKNRVKHWNKVVVGVIFLTSIFAILVMTIFLMIENKIEDTQDSFLKNAFNMCFKQIALIGVINLVLWLILQTKIATKLDSLLFDQNFSLYDLNSDKKSIVEPIFECLLSISVILLAWYIVYVIYFQFIVKRTIAWMRKTDNCDVLTVAADLESVEGSFFKSIWHRRSINRGKFLANRFEFIDNINQMSVPKVDPGGYYFMEYLRANILEVSVQMLRFPREVLVFVIVLSLILRQTLNFEGKNEVLILCVFSLVCCFAMLILSFYVFKIEDKLYPTQLSQYLVLKHNTNDMEISKYFNKSLLPPYKTCKLEEDPHNFLSRFVHGDAPVNRHENLFLFKSKGPRILIKVFEVICFSFLIVLSIWVYLVQQHPQTWIKYMEIGDPVILSCLFIIVFLIPKILYSLIVICKTGLLIELDTVEKVWEANRSNNTRHAMELIDALNLDTVVSSLNRNGETYWRHMLAKLKTSPLNVQKQMSEVWSSLDPKGKGVIGMTKILRFMSSQGLQVSNKRKMKEFIKAFTRTHQCQLTKEEFLVLGLVVKQIIVIPLDPSQMRVLFEEVYGIPWTSPSGIDSDTIQTIVKHLGFNWNEGERRHLLDFLSGGRCDGMSPENFIDQLCTVEQLLKPNDFKNLVSEI